MRLIDAWSQLRAAEAPPLPPVVFPGSGDAPFPLLAQIQDAYGGPAPGPGLLYLGDSVALRVARQDQDDRPLGRMVQDLAGGPARCAWVAGSAHQPELWLDVVRLFERRLPARPRTLLLPVNLRTFSTQWSGNPLWALDAERAALVAWRPGQAVPVIPAVVGDAELYRGYDRRWSGVPGLGRLGGLRRLAAEKPAEPAAAAERLARLLRWHYGAALKPGHRRLQALRATCELALALDIRPVVYVTPVNAEAALRHCGVELARRMAENVDVVRRELPGAVRFADFHAFLPESAFFHDNLSTEHLADVGRRQLAGAIVRLIGDPGR